MRARTLGVTTCLLTIAALLPTARAAGPSSPYPGGRYTPPAARYGTVVVQSLKIRASDGALLNADITYPTDPKTGQRAKGRFPVIVTQEAYRGNGVGLAELATGGAVPGEYFVQRGYIAVHFDQRQTGGVIGVGGSESTADLDEPRIGLDTLEVSYWAADARNVPGSNGAVGLDGCSALGINQIATLSQLGRLQRESGTLEVPGRSADLPGHPVKVRPASNPIKATIPACSNGDFYRDTLFDNGIPGATWNLFPAGPVFGVQTAEPERNLAANEALIDVLAGGDMGYDRDWYRTRNWIRQANDIARSGASMLFWTGWNEPGGLGNPPLYAAVQNAAAGRSTLLPMTPGQEPSSKYQMIMGEWSHGGGLDSGIQLEWYDTWLKGVDTGLRNTRTPLHIKELPTATNPRWINTSTYPVTGSYTPYYLDAAGTLSPVPAKSAGTETLPWAPGVTQTYTVAKAVDRDVTLAGPAAARLWVSSSNSNIQLVAQLVDVAPDGSTTFITHGSILGSRHQLDPARSWSAANGLPSQPYLRLDADRFLTPNTPVQLDVPLQSQIWRLVKGHKLQLWLGAQMPEDQCAAALITLPGGCTLTKPMYQTLPGGVYTILHDAKHPSLINVPLVPSSSLKTARAGTTPTSGGVVLPQDWG